MNPPTSQSPIGYFTDPQGRRVVVFAERPWYLYWGVELFNRVGGNSAPTNTQLARMSTPILFDEQDGNEEIFFIPQPKAAPAPAAQTIIFWDETLQDEPMMRV